MLPRERLIVLTYAHRGRRRIRAKTTYLVLHDALLLTTEDGSVTADSRPKLRWVLRLQETILSPQLIIEVLIPQLRIHVRHG